MDIDSFRLLSDPPRAWGNGVGVFQTDPWLNHRYFTESLPVFFERTIVFEQLDLNEGTLDWVLTGSRAGIMVSLNGSEMRVRQYFYDSYGLQFDEPTSAIFEEGPAHRAPWRVVADATIPLPSLPTQLTVRMDSRLQLVVTASGDAAITQECLFDVMQHQLRLSRQCRVVGRLVGPDPEIATLKMQPDSRAQHILGFGGITSTPTYHQLSEKGKARWWQIVRDYNLIIQREYPPGTNLRPDLSNWDRLEDALPHSYGDNYPNGEVVDFDYNRQIIELGGTTWFEFWFLPKWIKAEQIRGAFCDAPGLDVEAFCRTVVDYCRHSLEKSGAPPSFVGVQNERCQSPEILALLVPALRKALDDAGFPSVKLHMSNAGTVRKSEEFLDRFLKSGTWDRIDYASANVYDAQEFFTGDLNEYGRKLRAFTKRSGRPVIAPEFCINHRRFQLDSYSLAFCMAQLYHQCLTQMQAEAICYCWLLLHTPQPSYAWTRTLFTVDVHNGNVPKPSSHQLRAFGAFSRRVIPGSQRTECETGHPDLLASAYIAPEGGFVAVLLNRGIAPLEVAFEGPEDLQAEICSIYEENSPAPQSLVKNGDGRWMVLLAPGEVVTVF